MTSCLIKQSACGRIAGDPVCPKCGMDERVDYPGIEDRLVALLAAKNRFDEIGRINSATPAVKLEEMQRLEAELPKYKKNLQQPNAKSLQARQEQLFQARESCLQELLVLQMALIDFKRKSRKMAVIFFCLMSIGLAVCVFYFFSQKSDSWVNNYLIFGMVFIVFMVLVTLDWIDMPKASDSPMDIFHRLVARRHSEGSAEWRFLIDYLSVCSKYKDELGLEIKD